MCDRIILLLLLGCFIQSTVAAEKIPDVTVKAKKSHYSRNVPYFSQVITQEDINLARRTHLTDLLKNKAGLQGRDTTGNGANFEASLRGFGSNAAANTLILVDGIRQNAYDLMPPNLGYLPINDIERIEIIPGSLGTFLGEAATGGAIEIITKKPTRRLFNIRTYQGGPDLTRGLGLTYSNVLLEGGYRLGINLDNSLGYRARNKRNQKSGQITVYFPLTSQNLRFDYHGADEKIELPGALSEEEVLQDRRQAQNPHDFSQTRSNYFRGFYQIPISKHWGFDFTASARGSHMRGLLGNSTLKQERTFYSLGSKLIGNWLLSRGELVLSMGFVSDFFDYSLVGFTRVYQKTASPYVRMRVPLASKLALTGGARLMKQFCRLNASFSTQAECKIDPFLVKELSFEYSPSSTWQLYLRRDENFRLPKVDEQTWIASNTKLLKPQRGISYETGARWMDVGSISLYHLIIRNEIDFDPLALNQWGLAGANRNLEPTIRNGAMLETRYPISKRAKLSTHYTWTQARFMGGRVKGKKIPFVAEHVWGLMLNYTITPAWEAQIEYARTGNRYVMVDYENALPRLPGFGLLHATLSYHTKPWRFTLHAHNLTNVLYNEVAVLRFFYPAPERALTLNVEYAAE